MSVAIEHGNVASGSSGHEVSVSAPAVTSTSTILLTQDGGSITENPPALAVKSREPGVGFTISTGLRETSFNWVVIN